VKIRIKRPAALSRNPVKRIKMEGVHSRQLQKSEVSAGPVSKIRGGKLTALLQSDLVDLNPTVGKSYT